MNIRVMTIEDFDQVHALWMSIKGFGIRSVDDSKEGIERFLKRNPTTSVVAEEDGKIVGAILCGHDGRRGCLYHVCVDESQNERHRKSHGSIYDGGTEKRRHQQSIPDRIHTERYRQCILERNRMDKEGRSELLRFYTE